MPVSSLCQLFQSTLPARGATCPCSRQRAGRYNFNPRSPHGERPVGRDVEHRAVEFQSTLPARGATAEYLSAIAHRSISIHAPRTGSDTAQHPDSPRGGHFNPRSPHGERQKLPNQAGHSPAISIHAPRTGSDRYRGGHKPYRANFNPRSPHGERPCVRPSHFFARYNFNPRSPHGERRGQNSFQHAANYFNPRSPHGERLSIVHCCIPHVTNFNPRSPHGERLFVNCSISVLSEFQSTLPARGATPLLIISRRDLPFQSTLPARGATRCPNIHLFRVEISIHAPRTGSDVRHFLNCTRTHRFQSTLPARGATTIAPESAIIYLYFNPRSPHGERRYLSECLSTEILFQSTLPARGATYLSECLSTEILFQSTLPARGATGRRGRQWF